MIQAHHKVPSSILPTLLEENSRNIEEIMLANNVLVLAFFT